MLGPCLQHERGSEQREVSGVPVLRGRPCLALEPARAFASGKVFRLQHWEALAVGAGYPKG